MDKKQTKWVKSAVVYIRRIDHCAYHELATLHLNHCGSGGQHFNCWVNNTGSEVGKVTLKSNGDEALSDKSL